MVLDTYLLNKQMNYSFSSISHIHHHKPEQRDVIQTKNAEARPTIQLKKKILRELKV